MEYAKLPELDVPVSRLGLGGCPLGKHGWGRVDDDDSIAAVRRAWECGVNFFDTADVYGLGHSEQLIATALGPDRRRAVIATKFGVRRSAAGETFKDTSPAYLQAAVDASLKRLRIDHIPLYYMHWPDGRTPIEETVEAMERCRRQGKIGAIGLSNVSASELERAAAIATISAVQIQFSLVDREAASRIGNTASRHGIPLVTWGSLAQGLLTGKYDAETRFGPEDRRSRYENFRGARFRRNLEVVELLKRLSASLNRSPAQIAMRWLLETDSVGCVLFGAKTPSQVDENVAASDWSLAREIYQTLAQCGLGDEAPRVPVAA